MASDDTPEDEVPEEDDAPEEDDGLDEADRRILELERQLEEEAKQDADADMRQDLEEDEERRGRERDRKRKKKRRKRRTEAEDDAEIESAEDGEESEDDEEAPEDEGFLARSKASASKVAGEALTEIAAATLTSDKDVGQAAVAVVKKRLPSLPTRQRVRNWALTAVGVGVGGYLAWGILAPVFAFFWMLTKWALLGGAFYGGYWVYSNLPGGATGAAGEDADTEEVLDEEED